MANINATIRAELKLPTTPTVYNLSCPTAATEYSQALNDNAKSVLIRARQSCDIQLSFVGSIISPNFVTIPSGSSLFLDSINYSGSLYVKCSKPGVTVEILEWV